jgi:hypothetical protein
MAHHTIKVSWFCRATLGSAVATEPNLTSGRSFDPEPQILVIASVYDGFRMTRVEERHTSGKNLLDFGAERPVQNEFKAKT